MGIRPLIGKVNLLLQFELGQEVLDGSCYLGILLCLGVPENFPGLHFNNRGLCFPVYANW